MIVVLDLVSGKKKHILNHKMNEYFLCKEKFENVIYVYNQFNFFFLSVDIIFHKMYIYNMSIKHNHNSYFTYFVFVKPLLY